MTRGLVASSKSLVTHGLFEQFIAGNPPNETIVSIQELLPNDTIKLTLNRTRPIGNGTFFVRYGETRSSLNANLLHSVIAPRSVGRVITNNPISKMLTMEFTYINQNAGVYQITVAYNDIVKIAKLVTGLLLSPLDEQLARQSLQASDPANGIFFPVNSRFMPVRIRTR